MTDAPVHPDAATMNGVIPYLAMAGRAAEACDLYVRAFAAEELGRMPMPDGAPGLMHAQIAINGGALMMTDHGGSGAPPAYGFGHLQLVVDDGRFWWDRAVAAGCAVLAPYERQFWGDDWGLLEDPFGIRWGILQTGSQS
ncbi:glyoxalase/bleomycin resistance/extradiol dioxygenase family protein [Elioraea sp.]|uniref:VOC family protein n=1 Tax=Elioraea sp. TaxID=2185103 RepID=UPI0025BA2168|nr:glyoxalase/bleomycin resistance/extradiol dioxygenase family protein [Elioraea sp.]